ncbi:MAG: hypothetical protein KDE33_05605 [Bacteroidetes bacterium]|nr:hypothetical protein [Bacteroidota bacterium]
MTTYQIQKVGRIDQVVRDFFKKNPTVREVMAKDLMPLFIEKGIYSKDHRNGLPIRNTLRMLDEENQLQLLKNVKVVRHETNRNWYFVKR